MIDTSRRRVPDRMEVEDVLREIDDAISQQDYKNAEQLLGAAQNEWEIEDRGQQAQLERRIRELSAQRTQQIDQLAATIRNGLAASQLDYGAIEGLIDQVERLNNTHPALSRWREQLAGRRRTEQQEAQLQEIEQEVKRRWQEAEEAEISGVSGMQLIEMFGAAKSYAEEQAANIRSPRLQGLVQQATDRYNRIRNRHEVATTRQEVGEFRALITQLQQMDPAETVRISKDLSNLTGSVDTIPVSEALQIATTQAREYAADKAREIRNRALDFLRNHEPRAAHKVLNDALDLYGLDDEQKNRTREVLEQQVKPALDKREQAEESLREAEILGNALLRWQQLMAARTADPFVPDFKTVRAAILPGVERDLGARIGQARKTLQTSSPPAWQQVQTIASEVNQVAEQDSAFQEHSLAALDLIAESQRMEQLDKAIQQAIQEAQAQANTQAAYDVLLVKQAGWGEDAQRFPQLERFLITLQARANLQALLERFTRALRDSDLAAVEATLRDCEIALKEQPQSVELDGVHRRLRLHRDFLRGAALLRKIARTPEETENGLQLLRTVMAGREDDSDQAQKLVASVEIDEEEAAKLLEARSNTERALAQGNYEAAFKLLQPYRNRAAIVELWTKMTNGWEDELAQQLRKALAERPINEGRAKNWVQDLAAIGSRLAAEFKAEVFSRCAAERAIALSQRLSSVDWAMVRNAWDEALEYDPTNLDFQDGRRDADKKLRLGQLGRSVPERVAGLQELIVTYPSDIELRTWLIDELLKRALASTDLGEVEQLATQAQAATVEALQLANMLPHERALQAKLQKTASDVDSLLDMAQQCIDIEQQLVADKQVDAWQRALQQQRTLEGVHGQRLQFLQWWRRTRARVLNEAQQRLAAEQVAGADVWRQIHPAAQILTIDAQHNSARQTIQSVYGAILALEQQLNKLEEDYIGVGYPGKHEEIFDHQVKSAQELRHKFVLAEQVLMNFGGQFQDANGLRGKINELLARSNSLIGRLEQARRYVITARMAIIQAKSSDNSWYSFDEQRKLITDLGYGRHLTVTVLDSQRKTVHEKQEHLRNLVKQIEQAVKQGATATALRLAEQMMGRLPQPVDPKVGEPQMEATDDLADPTDDFGEQRRLRIQEPYTRRTISGLRSLVNLLQEQATQVNQLRAWLPSLPTFGNPNWEVVTINTVRPIASWQEAVGGVDAFVAEGKFLEARERVLQVISGDENGQYEAATALQPALAYLEQPPLAEEALISYEAAALWRFGRQLRSDLKADLETAYVQLRKVDRLTQEWDDSFRNFDYAVEAVRQQIEQRGLFGFGGRNKLTDLKTNARVAFIQCKEICKNHPSLTGWENHEYLGG